jgi:radical SAM modification target selenobiotic family peptide
LTFVYFYTRTALLTVLKFFDRQNQYSRDHGLIFSMFFTPIFREAAMQKKDLKKLLAGLGVAGLISMGGVTLPGAHAGSG